MPGLESHVVGPEAGLETVLEAIRSRAGVDFSHYRRPLIERRIHERMQRVGAASYGEYARVLAERPHEVPALIGRLTIKFSGFFRDRAVFDLLRDTVLPALRRQADGAPLTVWSAGCGNGEEAYSLAMLLDATSGGTAADGGSEVERGGDVVYGSDIDHAALDAARSGRYAPVALDGVPGELRRFFSAVLNADGHRRARVRCEVTAELRSRVHFLLHDLVAAAKAPVPRPCDLIACRNVLIYLNSAAQDHVLRLLCASLRPGGYVCLGEAEWPSPATVALLDVVDRRGRVFRLR